MEPLIWNATSNISIHALREEGDSFCSGSPGAAPIISIRALREEGDQHRKHQNPAGRNFYPRPPRGGRPGRRQKPRLHGAISIHALREEGDIFAA